MAGCMPAHTSTNGVRHGMVTCLAAAITSTYDIAEAVYRVSSVQPDRCQVKLLEAVCHEF